MTSSKPRLVTAFPFEQRVRGDGRAVEKEEGTAPTDQRADPREHGLGRVGRGRRDLESLQPSAVK